VSNKNIFSSNAEKTFLCGLPNHPFTAPLTASPPPHQVNFRLDCSNKITVPRLHLWLCRCSLECRSQGPMALMPAMSKDAISSSSRSAKDGSASGGFLSKASNSLRRSPSKRHKSQGSNPLPSLDQVFYEQQNTKASENNSLPQKRPDAHRAQTAPSDSLTIKSSLKEGKTPESAVEPMMVAAPFGNSHKKDTPATLSKSAGVVPTSSDPLLPPLPLASGNQTPNVLYQHIHDMASKRISTLDYFRKAYARHPLSNS
jgi:hypothetical protein